MTLSQLLPELPLVHVVNQLRHLVATRGRTGDLADLYGLRVIGHAATSVPAASGTVPVPVVGAGDDVVLLTSPEGALVVAAVSDSGTVSYLRLDNSNNLHVVDANGQIIVSTLTSILTQLSENTDSVDAVRDAVNMLRASQQYNYFGAEQNASATLKSGAGFCAGLWINVTVAATLLIRDALTDGTGTLLATLVLPVGTYGPHQLPQNFKFTTGLRVTLSAGTATFNGCGI